MRNTLEHVIGNDASTQGLVSFHRSKEGQGNQLRPQYGPNRQSAIPKRISANANSLKGVTKTRSYPHLREVVAQVKPTRSNESSYPVYNTMRITKGSADPKVVQPN